MAFITFLYSERDRWWRYIIISVEGLRPMFYDDVVVKTSDYFSYDETIVWNKLTVRPAIVVKMISENDFCTRDWRNNTRLVLCMNMSREISIS